MKTEKEIKEMVKQKYSEIALREKPANLSSCCGPTACCSADTYTMMSDSYWELNGYNSDADLGLGCGLPTNFAKIKKGDTVVDLGSGAGNDCFVASAETGENGRVIGIDFSNTMIAKARMHAKIKNIKNVEFVEGDIENIPLEENTADVVVSNCVLNLVPNKKAVFNEIYRVLKPGGHFSISDIVIEGKMPIKLQSVAEMYAGCVSGAIEKSVYLKHIKEARFENITIQKEKTIEIPEDFLSKLLTKTEILIFKNKALKILSVTVYAEKISN